MEIPQYCSNCQHMRKAFVQDLPNLWQCAFFHVASSTLKYVVEEPPKAEMRYRDMTRTRDNPTCPGYSQHLSRWMCFMRFLKGLVNGFQ